MRFIPKVRLWFGLRRQTYAQRSATKRIVESSKLMEKLEGTKCSLKKIIEEFEKKSEIAQTNIKQIKDSNDKLLLSLDLLRNENEVMAKVTIPALNAACQLQLERWNAETAIQVRRQVAVQENKEIAK